MWRIIVPEYADIQSRHMNTQAFCAGIRRNFIPEYAGILQSRHIHAFRVSTSRLIVPEYAAFCAGICRNILPEYTGILCRNAQTLRAGICMYSEPVHAGLLFWNTQAFCARIGRHPVPVYACNLCWHMQNF
jgi:hypothetical protein